LLSGKKIPCWRRVISSWRIPLWPEKGQFWIGIFPQRQKILACGAALSVMVWRGRKQVNAGKSGVARLAEGLVLFPA
jgi:hypothetical protein